MISQTTEYALRAVVTLADKHPQPMTTEQLSEHTQVPTGYLAKVMQQLTKGGLVKSQRGLHGGFRLLQEPKDITMLDVVRIVEPLPRISSCPLEIGDHGTDLCPLHRRLDNLIGLVEKQLTTTTISRLLAEKNQNKPLCSGRIV